MSVGRRAMYGACGEEHGVEDVLGARCGLLK